MQRSKTYSRELALCLFVWLGYLSYEGKTEELRILTPPFTAFALFSFGFKQPVLDKWVQQRSTESPDRGRT
jgi:hypothetical protein